MNLNAACMCIVFDAVRLGRPKYRKYNVGEKRSDRFSSSFTFCFPFTIFCWHVSLSAKPVPHTASACNRWTVKTSAPAIRALIMNTTHNYPSSDNAAHHLDSNAIICTQLYTVEYTIWWTTCVCMWVCVCASSACNHTVTCTGAGGSSKRTNVQSENTRFCSSAEEFARCAVQPVVLRRSTKPHKCLCGGASRH